MPGSKLSYRPIWVLIRDKRLTSGVRGPLAHVLLLPAGRHTGGVGINDEAGEGLGGGALRVGVGACEDKVEGGDAAVGDPHLLAVDDPLVPLLLGPGLDAGHVGARAGLGDAVGAHDGLLGEPVEVLVLLRVVAGQHDGHGAEAVGLERCTDAGATVGELLGHHAALEGAESHT